MLPLVGASGAWLGSFIISGGFLLMGGRRQYGMASYWRRMRPGAGRLRILLLCWRQFASFGRILCDRLLVYRQPERFEFAVEGGDHLLGAVTAGTGCILLSAHLGNWEVSGLRLKELIKGRHEVYVVMVRDDLPRVQSYVDERMRGRDITVIDPHDGLGASMAISGALRDGHTVCMLGDRVFGGQGSIAVDFLGGTADFPLGPFQAAAISGVPIVVSFLIKTGLRSYLLRADRPWRIPLRPRGPERDAAIASAVRRWARRLELEVRRNPFQWHNFFEFWRR
ncbi:MAG: lysophospholipid acyltransferase family protein [Planctomycetes bacterium]|nr:lysophospholipid acyltransferase family protein [Planctomycetota bacterium]